MIEPDGQIFHYDYKKIKEEENMIIDKKPKDISDELMKTINSGRYVTQYKTNAFSNEMKELLYSIKYDSINLKYKYNTMSVASYCYYCLVEYEDHSKLIKVKETGDMISKNKNRNINIICDYIEDALSAVCGEKFIFYS